MVVRAVDFQWLLVGVVELLRVAHSLLEPVVFLKEVTQQAADLEQEKGYQPGEEEPIPVEQLPPLLRAMGLEWVQASYPKVRGVVEEGVIYLTMGWVEAKADEDLGQKEALH